MSGYTRQTECRYVVERKSKILSRGKDREKRPTDTIKAVDSQASLVASLYCPVVVSHSCSHSQIRGSLAIKVITALIRAEIHPLPSSGGLIVRDNGVTMGTRRLRMSRNADVEADNQTPTHADQVRYSPRSPAWSPPAQCLPRVLCQMKHPPPVFFQTKDNK